MTAVALGTAKYMIVLFRTARLAGMHVKNECLNVVHRQLLQTCESVILSNQTVQDSPQRMG